MFFDAQLQVANIEVVPAEDHVQLAVAIATSLPAGPNAVLPLPVGVIRFSLGKDAAQTYGKELLEAGDNLPEDKSTAPSDIVIAQNLSGVEKVAAANEQFKGIIK